MTLKEALQDLGMRLARPEDMAGLRAQAAHSIGPEVTSTECLERVRSANGEALFVDASIANVSGRVRCFLALLPLTDTGLQVLRDGRFTGLDVDPAWVCKEGEKPVAVYVWGIAGESVRDRAKALRLAYFLEREVYPHLGHYSSAATQRGTQILLRRGFRPMSEVWPNAADRLFMRDPLTGAPPNPGRDTDR